MTIIQTYRGYEITITHEGVFWATLEDDFIHEPLLTTVKKRLDEYIKNNAKKIVLALPVVDSLGASGTIVGLHMGTSAVLTQPTNLKAPLYPNTLANAELLESLREAQEHVKEMMEALKKQRVNEHFGGRGRMSAEKYGGYMENLQQSYNNAVEVAEAQP